MTYESAKDIEKIVNGSATIQEKEVALEKYEKYIQNKLKQVKRDLYKGYHMCPTCKKWFREKSWEQKIEGKIIYDICPLGHKTETKERRTNKK